MAYNTMSTRSTGYLVTAADWNALIANDQADAVAAFAAKGDLFAATGANAGAALTAGADFEVPFYKSAETLGIFARTAPLVLLSNATEVSVANTTTETALWEVASPGLPANWLGTTGGVHMRFMHQLYNNSGASRNVTWKFYYGANSVSVTVNWPATASTIVFEWNVFLRANAATNAQELHGYYITYVTTGGGQALSVIGSNALATDSTADAALKCTITLAVANANLWVKERFHNIQYQAAA